MTLPLSPADLWVQWRKTIGEERRSSPTLLQVRQLQFRQQRVQCPTHQLRLKPVTRDIQRPLLSPRRQTTPLKIP
jgi:hypothetical protein